MGLILLLSVYVVAVMMYKLYQFVHYQLFNVSFMERLHDTLKQKRSKRVIEELQHYRHPIARVVAATLSISSSKKLSQEDKQRQIMQEGQSMLQLFERQLRSLEFISSIAPLLGLLGTVVGMVKAFASIEEAGSQVDPSMLAGGIWEALLTTIAGLILAIVALTIHHIIDNRVEWLRQKMEYAISIVLTGG